MEVDCVFVLHLKQHERDNKGNDDGNMSFMISTSFPQAKEEKNLSGCLILTLASAVALVIVQAHLSRSLNVSPTGSASILSALHLQAML